MARDFLTYSNRQYIITNRRVIAISGILDKFRDEFEYYIEHKRSRYDGNLECLKSS